MDKKSDCISPDFESDSSKTNSILLDTCRSSLSIARLSYNESLLDKTFFKLINDNDKPKTISDVNDNVKHIDRKLVTPILVPKKEKKLNFTVNDLDSINDETIENPKSSVPSIIYPNTPTESYDDLASNYVNYHSNSVRNSNYNNELDTYSNLNQLSINNPRRNINFRQYTSSGSYVYRSQCSSPPFYAPIQSPLQNIFNSQDNNNNLLGNAVNALQQFLDNQREISPSTRAPTVYVDDSKIDDTLLWDKNSIVSPFLTHTVSPSVFDKNNIDLLSEFSLVENVYQNALINNNENEEENNVNRFNRSVENDVTKYEDCDHEDVI